MLSMSQLSERIREIIAATGLSNSQIASAAKRTPAAVTQWLSGEVQSISAESAFALSDETGFEARWILFGEGPKKNPPPQPQMSDEEKRLVEHYRAGDDQAKRMLYRAAESIAPDYGPGSGEDDRPAKPRMRA